MLTSKQRGGRGMRSEVYRGQIMWNCAIRHRKIGIYFKHNWKPMESSIGEVTRYIPDVVWGQHCREATEVQLGDCCSGDKWW